MNRRLQDLGVFDQTQTRWPTIQELLAWLRTVKLKGRAAMWQASAERILLALTYGEFGAVVIIAYHPMTTPVMIFERFGAYGLHYARPVAILFIGICLVMFIVLRLLGKEGHNARR